MKCQRYRSQTIFRELDSAIETVIPTMHGTTCTRMKHKRLHSIPHHRKDLCSIAQWVLWLAEKNPRQYIRYQRGQHLALDAHWSYVNIHAPVTPLTPPTVARSIYKTSKSKCSPHSAGNIVQEHPVASVVCCMTCRLEDPKPLDWSDLLFGFCTYVQSVAQHGQAGL